MRLKSVFTIAFIFASLVLTAQKRSTFTVNFEFNKYEIMPGAAVSLDSFINYIMSPPATYTIELYGHTDSIGSIVYNDSLSVKRTEAVKTYLANRGILSNVITKEIGLGKSQPLNSNATEKDRFLNRRVVILLIPANIPVSGEVIMTEGERVEKIVEIPVAIPEDKTLLEIIKDPKTKAGSSIRLKNLNFIGSRHVLLPESIMVMMELIDVMENNPNLEIAIEGHICCWHNNGDGLDLDLGTYNLSEMRAKTVYDLLIKNGIDARRLTYKGFGHSRVLFSYPEKTEEERIANRRVEIRIIKK